MPLDPYSPCPGGTGKKIKFCCSDLVADLDKIQRMIEGEQFVACLDHVARLDAAHPGRPCLLSWKLLLEQMTGDREKSAQTLTAFIAQHPNNPIALAETALDRVGQGEVRVGIGFLQSAIEASGEQLSERVYAAIGAMGEMLVLAQWIVPARAHLMLQMLLTNGADERPVQIMMRLETMPGIPVLLKDTPPYAEPPEGVAWRDEFNEATRLAARGWWRAAAARWQKLADQAADAPAVWRNLAIVRGNLADYAGSIDALRKYALLDVPLDDAVEAEALAQLLDRDSAEGAVDSLLVTFGVADLDELERRLAGDKQADRMQIDTRALAESDEPPPRAVYWLLDRPVVTSGPEIAREQIPQILGQVMLYGKQTDREARVELDVHRPSFPAAREVLLRIAGDALKGEQSEEVTERISAVQLAMSWQWRLPSDIAEEHRRKLIAEARRELVLNRWPNLPLPLLDGKTPAQAAADPAYRVRLLAAILVLEMSDANAAMIETANELRRKLNLPVPDPIDPAGFDIAQARIVRFARLEVEKLTDEQLREAFHRLFVVQYEPALRRVALELVRRPSAELLEYKQAAYQHLVRNEEDSDKALELIEAGRKVAETTGRSTAPWDLDELAIRVQRQEGQQAARLIMHIRTDHAREPGVAEALFGILARLGLIGPDGTIMVPDAAAAATPGIVVPGAAAEPGKLWTPDSAAPTGKKSGLWVPE